MTIVSIDDLDTEPKFTEDEIGARTYNTRHLVTTDDANMKEADLLNDPAMPIPHVTRLVYDNFATCRRRRLARWENDFQWYLNIVWSTHRQDEHEDTDPFARAIVGGLRCIDKERPAHRDARGVLAVTTAGDLYKGLTKTDNIEVIDVEVYSQQWPTGLRALNNTVNNGPVDMFGESYGRRTLWMKNLQLPKNPTEQWGTLLWLTTFEVHHDPAGYFRLLPNAGLHELQYWTRSEDDPGPPRTFTEWERVDKAAYDAQGDTDLKRVTRERVETGSQQTTASEAWLNEHGEAILPSLASPAGVTCAVTNGLPTVTLTGGTIDPTFVGTVATITFTDFNGLEVPVDVRITSVAGNGQSFDAEANFHVTKTDRPIRFAGGGALFNYLEMQHEADWSNVPLPAVPPVLLS